MSTKISGSKYAAMYGPTTGDKVRLADTNLVIEVEKDYTTYGDEVKFGGGKTIRDGMGQSVKTCSKDGDLDLVITNALIVDSTGIVKADIGIKDGRIAGIGKAGNPDTMDGVTPGMTVGASCIIPDRSFLHQTLTGSHHQILILFKLVDRNNRSNPLSRHKLKEIDDCRAPGSSAGLRNFIGLQTVNTSCIGKKHHIMMSG